MPLASLVAGPQTGRLGGFLAPAWSFGRAVGLAERTVRMELEHRPERPSDERDWYTVRVRQVDGQAAWTRPVWVEAQADLSAADFQDAAIPAEPALEMVGATVSVTCSDR